jgi:membrane associated rhomboid family serine protease
MALFAGWVGYEAFSRSLLMLPDAVREADPSFDRNRFMAAWFAHLASYLTGGAGGILLLRRFWRQRGRPRVLPLFPDSKSGVVRAVVLSTCVVALIYWRVAGP